MVKIVSDLLPFEHGEEGTHSACRAQVARFGERVPCCACTGHNCETDPENFCWDKHCLLFQITGKTHLKGTKGCKYE